MLLNNFFYCYVYEDSAIYENLGELDSLISTHGRLRLGICIPQVTVITQGQNDWLGVVCSYPPKSKSEALQLGVHLILLYFIRISLLSAETFFFEGG